ncbi:MAG TPA: beta-ketoacyl synthase N-terminal-like domain-containing protein, partial [Thermodesulfovibrionales bacterium]|nr:beta-ketoacyl synthase N-terminal-like domain-containing protein [Thermodesulfovibrionales bacterium]
MDDRVVITGTGISCSLGTTRDEVWGSMLAGRSGIRPIEGFDTVGFGCRVAAQIQELNPRDLGISPKDSRIMDTHAYMLMKSSRDAYREAKLDTASVPAEETGFYAGMGMVDYRIEDLLPAVHKSLNSGGGLDYDAFFSEGYKEVYPLWPLSMLNNISFCQVAINLNIKGDNTVFSPHADSGAQAVIEGMSAIREGKAQ